MSIVQELRIMLKLQFPYVLFCIILLSIGAIFGFFFVSILTIDQHQDLSRYLGSFLQTTLQGQMSDLQLSYWDTVLRHMKWIFFIWLMGLSIIGLPVVAALNFLKGMLLGFTIGYVTSQLSWKGLLFSFLAIFPTNMLMIPALLIASGTSFSFAFFLVKTRLKMNRSNITRPFWLYTTVHFAIILIMPLVAWIEVFIVPFFFKWSAAFFV